MKRNSENREWYIYENFLDYFIILPSVIILSTICVIGIKLISLIIIIIMSLYIGVLTVCIYIKIRKFENEINNNEIYKLLQDYIYEINSDIKLVVGLYRNKYNASADIPRRQIKISEKWYRHTKNDYFKDRPYIEYIKCILLHELYHIKRNESQRELFLNNLKMLCPDKKIREKAAIYNWIEELSADKFACDMYKNPILFKEALEFKKNNKKKDDSGYSHPSWEIRIYFIENNIPITYENVKRMYELWKGRKVA